MQWHEVAQRKAQAEREVREALYRERLSLAIQFASQGHNRDVVFGVLIGRECEEPIARQISDSAIALHDSRRAPSVEKESELVMEETEANTPDSNTAEQSTAANPLGTMWFQFRNNLRF